jgi:hypothetical protein
LTKFVPARKKTEPRIARTAFHNENVWSALSNDPTSDGTTAAVNEKGREAWNHVFAEVTRRSVERAGALRK